MVGLGDSTVNPFIAGPCNFFEVGCYDAPTMDAEEADRPVFLPKFGLFLKELRSQSRPRWGTKQVAKAAIDEGYNEITRNRLMIVERGKVSDVSAKFLRQLADFYRFPYESLVARLIEEKYGLTEKGLHREHPGKTPTVPSQPSDTSGTNQPRAGQPSAAPGDTGVADEHLEHLARVYQVIAKRLDANGRAALVDEMEDAAERFKQRIREEAMKKASGK